MKAYHRFLHQVTYTSQTYSKSCCPDVQHCQMSWSDFDGSLLKKATGGAGVGVRSCGGRNCKAVPMLKD